PEDPPRLHIRVGLLKALLQIDLFRPQLYGPDEGSFRSQDRFNEFARLQTQREVPPLSWTPNPFRGKRSSRCPSPDHRTRRSSSGGSLRWCEPGGTRKSWRRSSSRRRSRSATGLPRPIATTATARMA